MVKNAGAQAASVVRQLPWHRGAGQSAERSFDPADRAAVLEVERNAAPHLGAAFQSSGMATTHGLQRDWSDYDQAAAAWSGNESPISSRGGVETKAANDATDTSPTSGWKPGHVRKLPEDGPGAIDADRAAAPSAAAQFGVPAAAPAAVSPAPSVDAGPATAAAGAAPKLGDSIATTTAAPIQVPDALKLKPEQQVGPAPRPANDHDDKTASRPDSALRAYLFPHTGHLWDAARGELSNTSWPAATEQFAWKDPRAFGESVLAAAHDHVMQHARSGDLDIAPLDELLYPARIADELGPMVPYEQHADSKTAALDSAAKMVNATVPDEKKGYVRSVATPWIPAIGLRFAQLLKTAITGSALRMTSRYLDAMNDRARAGATAYDANVRLSERDLITSRPIDRLVAHGLVTPNKSGALVAEVVPDGSVKPVERTSLRHPKLSWEGTRDKRFWCWVRADLPDATPEEVSAVLFAYLGGEPRTYLAYSLAQAGPLFGLPASWAIQFSEARDSAPESVKQGKLPDPATDTIAHRLMLVAGSDQADAIALQQAAKTPVGSDIDVVKVLEANEDIIVQLQALRMVLTPWGLSGDLIPIVMRAVTKRDTLRRAPASEVMAYAAAAIGERERLTRIAGSITNTIAAGKQFPGRDADNPVHAILGRYAQAATTAQLADVSEGLIAEAQTMQRRLVVKSLQANQLAAMQAMDEMHAGPAMRDPKAPVDDRDFFDKTLDDAKGKGPAQRGAAKSSSAAARQLGAMYNDAQTRARVLENTLLQGGEVDADELQRVQLESQEVSLRARLENLNAQLDAVADEAAAAENAGISAKLASIGSGRFRGLRDMTLQLRAQLVEVRRDLILDPKAAKPKHGDEDGLTPPPVDVSAKRDALIKAQGRFELLSRDYDLQTYLERAYSLIEDQRFRTTLVNVAAMIGFSLAGSGLAATIAKGAGRALTTAEGVKDIAELSLAARGGIFAMRVATETLANASGQVMMSGDSVGNALAQNALLSLGMEGTSALISRDVATARAFSKALAAQVSRIESVEAKAAMRASTAGAVAKLVGREAIGISGHAVMGMALGAISQEVLARLEGGGQAHAASAGDINTDAIIQAASVAIGRMVHARIEQRREAIDALARKSGTAEGQRLGAHALQLENLTTLLVTRPAAERAQASLEVLEHQERLIDQEVRVIDEMLARADHGGFSADELKRTRAELIGQRANAGDLTMLNVKFHLMGLRELAPGTLWSGTPAEVARAIGEIQATQPKAQVRETEPGVTTATIGDHEVAFHTIAEPAASKPTDAPTTARPKAPGEESSRQPGPKAPEPVVKQGETTGGDATRENGDVGGQTAAKLQTDPQSLRDAHARYEGEGVQTPPIKYDPASGKAYFEVTYKTGTVTRVEAPMGNVKTLAELHRANNKVVGHPVDLSTGLSIIERLNRGDASALASVGIGDSAGGKLPTTHEFGLGQLSNGDVVVVIGEDAAVDWAYLPGMKPRAHTHPAAVHDIPKQNNGQRSVPLSELLTPKPEAYIPREVVLPSGADIITMAHDGTDGHIVVTEFVLRDGTVMKAPEGDGGARLIFTILGAHELPGLSKGRKVYQARIVGKSGTETPINHDVWVVAHENGTTGNLFMTKPPDLVLTEPGRTEPGRTEPSTQRTTDGERANTPSKPTKMDAQRGVPEAPLTPADRKRSQALMENWRKLGIDELRELVRLRERGGEATYEPETPEHKVNAWERTKSDKAFEKWSPVYHRNINNSKTGLAREADFRARLDNGNGQVTSKVIQTARGGRQVDASMPSRYLELKSGDEDLSRERHGGQLPNLEAILRDRLADKPVVWVIEGKASQPLRDMLNGIDPPGQKIEGPQGPKTPLEVFEGEGAFEAAIAKYALPPKAED